MLALIFFSWFSFPHVIKAHNLFPLPTIQPLLHGFPTRSLVTTLTQQVNAVLYRRTAPDWHTERTKSISAVSDLHSGRCCLSWYQAGLWCARVTRLRWTWRYKLSPPIPWDKSAKQYMTSDSRRHSPLWGRYLICLSEISLFRHCSESH